MCVCGGVEMTVNMKSEHFGWMSCKVDAVFDGVLLAW